MYRAPVEEIAFTLKHVADLKQALDAGAFGDLGEDLVDAVLGEAGRFATEEIAPLAKVGDEKGTVLKDGAVTTPPGWKELYRRWIDAGWNALSGPEAYGGQALPTMMAMAAHEMWSSAAMAFGLGPMLTMGTIEALDKHASDALKKKYLARLVSGEWMGTMNLTEPQAGSDLAALKMRAEPAGDGTYRLFGQKIFITYGEHDFSDNIVHMVLARLPDAPAGTRGISLFLVPKFLVNDDGSLGSRNDVFCSGLEHKLGIHGSPTCTMIYGDGFGGAEPGAVGWLIGEENKGLACMFTMMNNARLAVGIQGVALAEAATQHALSYARERTQGKAPGWQGKGMSPIIEHPDIARMLLTMKAMTQGARAIAFVCAHAVDRAHASAGAGDSQAARHWQERSSLLTPIAKSFGTDIGVDAASMGIQIHGGMGFIEETGAARYLRDARIAPIYEGTNGIQAIDLVTRKLPLSDGAHMRGFLGELKAVAAEVAASNLDGFGETAHRLDNAIDDLAEATDWLLARLAEGGTAEALAGATAYQRLFGLTLSGVYLAKGGLAEAGDDGREARIALCRFAAENLLSETATLKDRIVGGAESLSAARIALA
jgi:alkylation response protein AidB-like acyl-CoA dehydrogenase